MARLDYYAIENQIKTILEADSDVTGHWGERNTRVLIEREMVFGMDELPAVMIYLDRRDATPGQPIAAGTRTRLQLRFSIWCVDFHLDSMAMACEARDDLMGLVEVALMKNRDLDGKVGASWIEGGEFMSAENDGSFIAAGEIVLVADGVSTT